MDGRSSELFVPAQIPQRNLLQESQWFLSLLETFPDLDRTKASRFTRMARAVADGPEDLISATTHSFPLVQQALRDLHEFHFFWHVLGVAPEHRSLWRRVKRVIGGQVVPSASAIRDAARDTQFELLVEASLRRAGANPTHHETGVDFRCTLGTEPFVVEAKRVSSLNKVTQRIGEAANQIASADLPGIICVDFAQAVWPGDKVLIVGHANHDWQKIQFDRFQKFWQLHKQAIATEIGSRLVLGIAFFDTVIAYTGLQSDGKTGNWPVLAFRDHQIIPQADIGHARLVKNLFECMTNLGQVI